MEKRDERQKTMTEKMTPLETVKAYCAHCLGMPQHNADEIRDCQGDQSYVGPCPLFPYRMGRRIPIRVFRAFCIDCMGGQPGLVKDCPATTCEVFPYRMGKNPAKQGQGASRESMQRVRESRKTAPESISTGQFIGKVVSL